METTTARGGSEDGGDRRWERRKEARPGEIVSAALDCFAERGFAATRLEDVARRAGVTKGTLYLYFPNKEELFKAVVRESLVPHLDRLMGREEGEAEDPADRLRRVITAMAGQILGSRLSVIPKLVVSEAGNFPEIARFYRDEVIARGRVFVAETIREGVERGQFRPVDPDQAMFLLMGPMLLAALWPHTFGPVDDRPFDAQALVRTHLDHFFRGLSPGPDTPDRDARSP